MEFSAENENISWDKRKENIYKKTFFLSVFRLRLCLYKQTNNCLTVFVSLRKSKSEIGLKLVFFTFLWKRFCGNIIQEHKLLPGCVFGPFTYVYCKNCMPGFCGFVVSLSKFGNILFRLTSNRNFRFSSASIVIGT